MTQEELRFDGETYDPDRDRERLSRQLYAVLDVMKDGIWRTLPDLANATQSPEASVSARLRDLRKPRFGSHTVERQYLRKGLFQYRLILNEEVA
jgi:hypothetical protein